jgi:hypothetical protein
MERKSMRRFRMKGILMVGTKKKKNLSRDRKFISEAEIQKHRRKTKGKTYVKHKNTPKK